MRPRTDDERVDWLRLIRSPTIGPATFHSLYRRFGSARAALDAMPDIAARVGAAEQPRIATVAEVEREMATARRVGASFVFYGTAEYPPLLAEINAPPPVIMVRGDVAILQRPAIAVVGSRQASAVGRTMARKLAEAFSRAGRVVVSGLALGIDAEAHAASLAGGTVAVLAGGVDNPTPEANQDLARRIADSGALVSEMPLGTEPFARFFVRRNRLIAGLAEACVVVEAAARSGSLHTAHFAAEANRQVFAVPGSPLDPRALGCLELLRDGATMVIEPRDVLDALTRDASQQLPRPSRHDGGRAGGGGDGDGGGAEARGSVTEPGPPDGAIAAISAALSLTPVKIDALVRATGLSAAETAAALVELELAGRAERDIDGTVRAAVRQ